MPDPVQPDGWTDGQQSDEGQCKLTKPKVKMSDPARSDGWTDVQTKWRRPMQVYKTKRWRCPIRSDPVRSDGWMDRQCKFQRGCKFTHKFPGWKFTQRRPIRSDPMDGRMDKTVKKANASLQTKKWRCPIRSDPMDMYKVCTIFCNFITITQLLYNLFFYYNS